MRKPRLRHTQRRSTLPRPIRALSRRIPSRNCASAGDGPSRYHRASAPARGIIRQR